MERNPWSEWWTEEAQSRRDAVIAELVNLGVVGGESSPDEYEILDISLAQAMKRDISLARELESQADAQIREDGDRSLLRQRQVLREALKGMTAAWRSRFDHEVMTDAPGRGRVGVWGYVYDGEDHAMTIEDTVRVDAGIVDTLWPPLLRDTPGIDGT